MGRHYPYRLPICCAFVVCFVGSAFGIPLLEDIPLEQQRKLTERPFQNLQMLDQLDREKALHVVLELSSAAIRKACQDVGDVQQMQRETGRHAISQCHGFFYMFPEATALELPPETLLEHNYHQRQKSNADIRSTSVGDAPTLRHSPQSLNSQSKNFLPDAQTDLERKTLNMDGRRSGVSATRMRFNPESFYSDSDRPGIERPTRQAKFGAFQADYETPRDPRQIKFLVSYPDYKTMRNSRQAKFEALYPDYETLRDPRQLKFLVSNPDYAIEGQRDPRQLKF